MQLLLCSQLKKSIERKHNLEEKDADGYKQSLVKCKLNKKEYYLVLDTGASTSVIDKKYKGEFENLKLTGYDSLQSVHNTDEIVSVFETTLLLEDWLYFCKVIFNESTLWDELTEQYNLEIPVIGVLGYDFLQKYQCLIDLRRKQLITNIEEND